MSLPSGPKAEKIGFLLTRVVVPLWVLSGALMKLIEKSPKLLPKNIWTAALERGVDLYVLLFVLIALEFFAIAVMVFLPRFARFMSIWMLSIFCLVLIAEIAAGNSKCGCLGAFSPPPQWMLAIDGVLLLLVLLFRPPKYAVAWVPKVNFAIATVWTLVFGVITGVVILGERAPSEPVEPPARPPVVAGGQAESRPVEPKPPSATKRPAYFGLTDVQGLVGRRFRETELAGLVTGLSEAVDAGPQYVIFFSRSCDHCQDLLETHLQGTPAAPVTLVAIPEGKSGFNEGRWIDMNYCVDCATQLELVTGVDYLITPPLVLALAEGEIVCAKEADDAQAPECLVFGM